ncbi:MAG TPA: DNA polymerase III subunit alpha [Solirubrobacteraceae bacterium]|jgi:error-prone DNA polymerase|nr:DNA polymerase III subunit alpha [Solirubrobacteraceae bacterium]
MSPTPYVELHCHSAYSFLDGVSLPEELAGRAVELGHEALALTDHNSVSGSMELAQTAADYGLRAIHGAEIDLAGGRDDRAPGYQPRGRASDRPARPHVTLLVEDERGWRNLCRVLTIAHAHTRGNGSPPTRRELGEPSISAEAIAAHAEGLVCLTGCARRSVLGEQGEGGTSDPARGRTVRTLLEGFGPERLYVELQRPYARDDRARNRAFAAAARRLGLRTVASGDVHAHSASRAELQDAFVALRHRLTLDASEPLRRGNRSHVMTTPRAMASRFADHPEAVAETVVLADRLRFDLTKDLGYRYPGAEEDGASRRLAELCAVRLAERYGPRAPSAARARGSEAERRLREELQVIDKLGLAGFFLLHHEMLELAREVAVEVRGPGSVRALLAPGRGRGSSVSSLVCYLTGLSHIDPVENDLTLGRFLHEDLHGLPDIDLDFPRDIRERLIPRVHDRFGRDRAALVAAFPTYRVRGAVRELGKVLGLPPGEIERIARGADPWGPAAESGEVDFASGRHERDSAERDSDRRSSRWRWLRRLVEEAQGLPRHLSQHSGGMIIATRPLIDCCPVVPAAMEGRQMVHWDKDSCADAGFLKIDLLGLGMLSAVERCVEEVHRQKGERIDLSRIPFDDPETFRAIRAADTVGVFQIESRAQMQSLLRTRPRNLDDVTIQVAIVRPGPIQGGAVNPYIKRLQRLREDPGYQIPYDHPSLEPVLKETLGTIIFQDQVMQVAEAFAGFTPGEADGLRRAMSRKRSGEMLRRHRERFIEGAMRHSDAPLEVAERVWQMVEGFAGFGFPKAHSAAFGLLAYQSTWLRVHHGPEFLCALLNEQPMGFYAPDSLVHEAQNRDIAILGLDVNSSEVLCTVQNGAVRLGLGYVKGVAETEMHELVAERERGGRYRALGELAARSGCRRVTLEQLAWSGACDGLLPKESRSYGAHHRADRRTALWQLGMASPAQGIDQAAEPGREDAKAGAVASRKAGWQLALPFEEHAPPPLRELGRWQRLIADYSTSGVTIGDHAMAVLRPRLVAHRLVTSAQLARLPSGCEIALAGLVIARQRPGTANGTTFLLFEDEFGTVNLIVPRQVFERRRHLARAEPMLLARGRLERHQEGARRLGDGEVIEPDGEPIRPVINLLVSELEALERYVDGALDEHGDAGATVHALPRGPGETAVEEADGAEVGSSMRAVAPPIQSFARGRRR